MISVVLLNDCKYKKAPLKKKFQQWVNMVPVVIPHKIPEECDEICISLVDQPTSAHLNETYRHKKGPTNILSFNYPSIPGIPQTSLGDLAICAKIVETEARTQEKNNESHWAHLTVHGVLHLLGYDHIAENEAHEMESLEINILNKLGFPNPYDH